MTAPIANDTVGVIRAVGSRGVVIGPSCVSPLTTPSVANQRDSTRVRAEAHAEAERVGAAQRTRCLAAFVFARALRAVGECAHFAARSGERATDQADLALRVAGAGLAEAVHAAVVHACVIGVAGLARAARGVV